jgi:hypothetical protein
MSVRAVDQKGAQRWLWITKHSDPRFQCSMRDHQIIQNIAAPSISVPEFRLGGGSVFGFHRPFRYLDLAASRSESPTTEFRIGSVYRNRYCPGRSGCRSLPGGDSGHSCIDGQHSPSAAIADENWNKREFGYIIIQARALHGFGVWYRGTAQVKTRYHACLNGTLSLPDSFPGVTSRD